MGLARSLRHNRQTLLLITVVLVLFVLALVLWTRGGSSGGAAFADPSAPGGRPSASGTLPVPSSSPSSGATASGRSTGASGRSSSASASHAASGGLPLPPLSTDINQGTHGVHIVSIRATSDKQILRVAYVVRGGTPAYSYRTYINPPILITATAHGDGVVAEIAAQASPGSKSVSCQIAVDGKVTANRTATGSFAIVVCVG